MTIVTAGQKINLTCRRRRCDRSLDLTALLLLLYLSFQHPIENGQDKNASEYEIKRTKSVTAELRRILAPHLLQVRIESKMPPRTDWMLRG